MYMPAGAAVLMGRARPYQAGQPGPIAGIATGAPTCVQLEPHAAAQLVHSGCLGRRFCRLFAHEAVHILSRHVDQPGDGIHPYA